MPIDLVDLSTYPPERYGPFETPQEADQSAERSGFTAYSLWQDGERIKLVGKPAQPPEDGVA